MEIIILGFILVVIVIYLADKYFMNYWTRRGVKQIDGSFLFGNIRDQILQKEILGTIFKKIYDSTKNEKFVGVYFSYRPGLLVIDPNLVKDILIKDFTAFHDRGTYVDQKHDILSGHLFSLGGQKWRDLRVKLSPMFTSGKLKEMFPVLMGCTEVLQKYLEKEVKSKNNVFDVRDLSARLTTDIIASVAFGVEVDCINEPNHPFRVMGRRLFVQNFKNGVRILRMFMFPKSKLFAKLKNFDDDVEKFFVDLVRDTIGYREKNVVKRNDFMQLLIQLKNEGYKSVDQANERKDDDDFEYFKDKSLSGSQKITFEEACAQAFIFYAAGFETSSTATSFCLYELAKNPDVQRKLQEEIDEILLTDSKTHELNYEKIMSMKYLNACVDEILRMYPPGPLLIREAIRDYQIPGVDTVIEKGTSIIIPVYALHHDPQFYPEPEKFIPERFLKKNPSPEGLTFLPFGDGPRKCIGMRMGHINTKLALVAMLSKFKVEMTKNLPYELKFEAKAFIMMPTATLNLKFTERAIKCPTDI